MYFYTPSSCCGKQCNNKRTLKKRRRNRKKNVIPPLSLGCDSVALPLEQELLGFDLTNLDIK